MLAINVQATERMDEASYERLRSEEITDHKPSSFYSRSNGRFGNAVTGYTEPNYIETDDIEHRILPEDEEK